MLLKTIQKRNKLNDVYSRGEKGPGGAYHFYSIETNSEPVSAIAVVGKIKFQNGPRKDDKSTAGILDTDLLEIVRHRLQCFQEGEYATRENAIALTHIEEALLWMNKRVEDRAERGVLGTTTK